jgi:uncharacterized protein (DUF433 family)
MVALETDYVFPLVCNSDGVILIVGTRVPLETVIHHFKLGATAEQIAHKFPSVRLVDIYSAITYYLSHREQVEEYLAESDAEAARVQSELGNIAETSGVRERLLRRDSNR